MLLIRHIDNYLNFLSSLLYEIFVQRPECMRSSQSVEIQFVLSHDSMEALVRGLAEKKVENLSYESFARLREFFDKNFSLSICTNDESTLISEFIETRNIAVHNRAIINRRYVERTGKPQARVGTKRLLGTGDLEAIVPILFGAVRSLDREARAHLAIRGHRLNLHATFREEYDRAEQKMSGQVYRRLLLRDS
jgi:hypothetical protein